MRDQLKDEAYFENKISKIKGNIDSYESLLIEVIKEHGEDSKGAINGRMILVDEYINLIDCEYSFGSDVNQLHKYYDRLLQLYTNNFTKLQQSYTKLIKILSLGVLFNVDSKQLLELEQKLNIEYKNDYFVDYLLTHIDNTWKENSNFFSYPGFYESLKEVIDTNSIELLVKYDKSIWYKSHKEEAWYNSHKSKRNTYCGYWDYEGAAVAKILNISSSQLQKAKYLPYDLIISN